MAYSVWTGTAFAFNSTTLTSFVRTISGLAVHAVKQDFHPAGVAWPTPVDTGQRQQDDIVVEFMADGGASGPNVKCALGTSSTLTMTLDTGQSITGTFWVSDVEYGVSPEQDALLTCTFTPTGTVTWDLTT